MDIKPPKRPNQDNNVPTEPDLRELMGRQPNTTLPTPPSDEDITNYNPTVITEEAEPVAPPPSKRKRINLSKKQKIIVIIVLILLTIGLIAGYFLFFKQEDQQPVANVAVEEVVVEEPPKYYSPLTGVEYETEAPTVRPVTAVMVENSPDARPQSGLEQADLVFEAIAEAGVTRFMAVYQESTPNKVGPVRSARPYYIDYALAFNASYAHVGGSPQALQDIRTLGVKDIDEFANSGTFWRASDRYAPHNAYTSFERLDVTNQKKGYTKSEFTPFERKIDVPQTPKASTVNFSISGPNYNAVFNYDAATNSYTRQQAGAPHKDAQTGKQINPKVVIALITNKGIDGDGYHSTYKTVGEGKILVFQDGIVSEGTWSKNDRSSSLNLKDKYGLPMKLNAGKTWITLLGSADDVRYSN